MVPAQPHPEGAQMYPHTKLMELIQLFLKALFASFKLTICKAFFVKLQNTNMKCVPSSSSDHITISHGKEFYLRAQFLQTLFAYNTDQTNAVSEMQKAFS